MRFYPQHAAFAGPGRDAKNSWRVSTCKRRDIQIFNLLSRPGCSAEKLQAGFHRRIILEAIDIDPLGEFIPAVVLDQPHDNALKRQPMQGVVRLLVTHA